MASATLDPSWAKAVMNRLCNLLAADDSEAEDVLEENLDLLDYVPGAEAFAKVDQAIKQFDFEKALGLLKDRAAALNIPVADSGRTECTGKN